MDLCSKARAMTTCEENDAERRAAAKAALRKEALARRKAVHMAIGAAAAAGVLAHGLRLLHDMPAETISGYLPIRSEIDVVPLLEAMIARGRRIALPVIEDKAGPLVFRQWRPGDPLVVAGFGLSEPCAEAPRLEPDILLTPLAAFDKAGYRLGYGGGYYDRTFALYRRTRTIVAIGVAYDEQEVAELPVEPHDQRLDCVLTPSGARFFDPE